MAKSFVKKKIKKFSVIFRYGIDFWNVYSLKKHPFSFSAIKLATTNLLEFNKKMEEILEYSPIPEQRRINEKRLANLFANSRLLNKLINIKEVNYYWNIHHYLIQVPILRAKIADKFFYKKQAGLLPLLSTTNSNIFFPGLNTSYDSFNHQNKKEYWKKPRFEKQIFYMTQGKYFFKSRTLTKKNFNIKNQYESNIEFVKNTDNLTTFKLKLFLTNSITKLKDFFIKGKNTSDCYFTERKDYRKSVFRYYRKKIKQALPSLDYRLAKESIRNFSLIGKQKQKTTESIYFRYFSLFYGKIKKSRIKVLFQNFKKSNSSNIINLLYLLEARLDLFLVRCGFFSTLKESRQCIKNNLIFINNKKVTSFNFLIEDNMLISLDKKIRLFVYKQIIAYVLNGNINNLEPKYVEINYNTMSCIFLKNHFQIKNIIFPKKSSFDLYNLKTFFKFF